MKETIVWLVAAALYAAPAVAADINVMSGGAPKEALNVLIPKFEHATGHHVKMTYVLISALRQRIADGEAPDMVIMPTTAIDGLIKLGRLKQEDYQSFGTVRLVAIARKGATRPDITTPDAFKEALLKLARSSIRRQRPRPAAHTWRNWSIVCKSPTQSKRKCITGPH